MSELENSIEELLRKYVALQKTELRLTKAVNEKDIQVRKLRLVVEKSIHGYRVLRAMLNKVGLREGVLTADDFIKEASEELERQGR